MTGPILVAAISAITLTVIVIQYFDARRRYRASNERLLRAERQFSSEQSFLGQSWQLSYVTLEAYYSRNLSQLNQVFVVSIILIAIGVGMVVWSITAPLPLNHESISPSLLGAASGAVTQIIGGALMTVYRATVAQSMSYLSTLERINAVGMAVQIIDGAVAKPNREQTAQMMTMRANIVALLMSGTFGSEKSSSNNPEISSMASDPASASPVS